MTTEIKMTIKERIIFGLGVCVALGWLPLLVWFVSTHGEQQKQSTKTEPAKYNRDYELSSRSIFTNIICEDLLREEYEKRKWSIYADLLVEKYNLDANEEFMLRWHFDDIAAIERPKFGSSFLQKTKSEFMQAIMDLDSTESLIVLGYKWDRMSKLPKYKDALTSGAPNSERLRLMRSFMKNEITTETKSGSIGDAEVSLFMNNLMSQNDKTQE